MATKKPFVVKHGLEVTGNVAITGYISSSAQSLATLTDVASSNTLMKTYVDTELASLVDSSPAALDTLNELAAALGDDANFATTINTNLAQKLGASATVTLTGDATGTGTFSSNAVSVAVTIADDSHNHTIANVDGLQAALDAKYGTADLRVGITHVGYDSDDYIAFTENTSTAIFVNGTERVTADTQGLDVSGRIVADSTIQAYSDSRLKENVEVIEGAVEKVKQVRGVTYNRIKDGVRDTGVIAQELEAVLPEAVHDNEDGMKSVSYGNVVGLLIEAIKEQQAQIEELKAQIDG